MTAVLLAILASYRLAILIVQERGPFDAALLLRSWTLRRVEHDTEHWAFAGLVCIWCTSFWTALLCWALISYGGRLGTLLVGWWGVAGGVLVLDQLVSVQQDQARAAEEEAAS